MAELRPFRGVRFDPARAGADLGSLIAPPFDVIEVREHAALLERDPHNVVRLELPLDRPGGRPDYAGAARLWGEWLDAGALRRDERPALYVHEHEFDLHGERRRRRGVFGAIRLEPWEAGVVLPHERTLARPKEDRLNLMRAVPANLSPIFALHRDATGQAAAAVDAIPERPPARVF